MRLNMQDGNGEYVLGKLKPRRPVILLTISLMDDGTQAGNTKELNVNLRMAVGRNA